jgi:hypothetical protein
MKTIRRLTERKLEILGDRLSEKYWKNADVYPEKPQQPLCERMRKFMIIIARERLRRAGVNVDKPVKSGGKS